MKRLLTLILVFLMLLLVGCSPPKIEDTPSSSAVPESTTSLDPKMTWTRWKTLYLDNLEYIAQKRPDRLVLVYSYLTNEAALMKMLKNSNVTFQEWNESYSYLLDKKFVSGLFASQSKYEEWRKMIGFTFVNTGKYEEPTVVNPVEKPTSPEGQDASRHPTYYTPWQAVPLVTAEMRAKGNMGGEGSQWPLYITMSATDPNLGFMGTDVGGMYRTLDGGDTWAMSTVGIYSSAATGIAIDPKNANRVICVGVNSIYWHTNGLYLSTNKGDEWEAVYTYGLTGDENSKICGHRDTRQQVAFDPTSYDKKLGYCTTVYWCKETKTYGNKGESSAPRIYKSTDGGKKWSPVNSSNEIGGGQIAVSPSKGYVYIAHENGVFRSTDGGKSFKKILNSKAYGIDVIMTKPDNLYISAKDGFYVSKNNGDSFEKINVSGYPTTYPARVRVSPADSNYMILQDDHLTGIGQYSSVNYYSHDGGKTWHRSITDASESFIPYNVRQTVFAWKCDDRNVCVSTGGDMIMRSKNGGAKFVWDGNGYNGSCATSITVNANDPRLMAVGNQDYNGAYSTDAGKTWKYIDWSKYGWGGWSYGAYAIDDNHVVAVMRHENVFYIAYTTDGAKTTIRTNLVPATSRVYGAYGKNNIVFAGDYRSTDKGVTWSKMSGCVAVYTYSKDGALYGVNSWGGVVKSTDYGESWSNLCSVNDNVRHMTFDHDGNRLLILSNSNKVYSVSAEGGSPGLIADFSWVKDVTGDTLDIRNVAVDPENSKVIYVCSARGVYACATAVLRSVDGGKTWANLSRNPGDGSKGADGARDISNFAVNPVTRELFAIGGCRGMYKMKLPKAE